MIQRRKDTKYRLTRENNEAIVRLTEELKLDNPSQTLNVIVKNYAIFKQVERLFLSFTGFLEAFQELTVKNMGTMLREAGITEPKQAQKIKDSLKKRDKKAGKDGNLGAE
jgi:hypothetical protein